MSVLTMLRSGAASICVTVGSLGAGVRGSSVSTLAKFEPETVPWFATLFTPAGSGGPLTVTRKTIVTCWPAGSVPMLTGKPAASGAVASGRLAATPVARFASLSCAGRRAVRPCWR